MTPVDDLAFAVVLGGAFGVGACLLISLAPRVGAVPLSRRIAPYIRDVTDPLGLTPPGAHRSASAVTWGAIRDRVQRTVGTSASLDRRLRRAAWRIDGATFRGRQLAAALGGVAIGGLLVVALVLTASATGAVALLPPVLGAAGALACDAWLTRAAHARSTRIDDELPTVLEFLALCLAAGEGLLDSLRRVGGVGTGELTGEIRDVVLRVGTGSSLTESLTEMSQRLDIDAVSRTVDHLVAAIDRGAPLAHVLHAQALDAREESKRRLIERAGRKEIYMLVPLVFLILPLSVLFAVFPGVFMLRLGIG